MVTVPAGVRAALDDQANRLFGRSADVGVSLALVVQRGGQIVLERYGHHPDTVFGPGSPVGHDSTLLSWSMAKSITHAAVGIAVADGLLDLDAPAPVPSWAGTEKATITLLDLLEMRPGLEFVEDYVDDSISHCIEMLFGSAASDMAGYAAALPLLHEPGTVWNYSSGTTNIIARIVGDAVGGGREGMERFLRDRLFGPVGMHSAQPKFDDAGTFVGSSYVYATARDFAKFGRLYLDDGVTSDGHRVLPVGWTDHARAQHSVDAESGFGYGRQWWTWPQFPGSLGCHGYEGQYTVVAPDRDLVVVHLGKTPAAHRLSVVDPLAAIVAAFAP
jgi:CubicO group peptidase (beta-lactamase class C family)